MGPGLSFLGFSMKFRWLLHAEVQKEPSSEFQSAYLLLKFTGALLFEFHPEQEGPPFVSFLQAFHSMLHAEIHRTLSY